MVILVVALLLKILRPDIGERYEPHALKHSYLIAQQTHMPLVQKTLTKLNITAEPIFAKDDSAEARVAAHLAIWDRMITNNIPHAIVFEDTPRTSVQTMLRKMHNAPRDKDLVFLEQAPLIYLVKLAAARTLATAASKRTSLPTLLETQCKTSLTCYHTGNRIKSGRNIIVNIINVIFSPSRKPSKNLSSNSPTKAGTSAPSPPTTTSASASSKNTLTGAGIGMPSPLTPTSATL